MSSARLKVLQSELIAVRVYRSVADLDLVRASLDREEELLAEIARANGEESNVLPMAASFSRRDEDPGTEAGK
jgi:hypothetical protein